MLPLRSSEGVEKFPWASLVITGMWLVLGVAGLVLGSTFLEDLAFSSQKIWPQILTNLFFHKGFVALFTTLVYAWVFTPLIFEKRGTLLSVFFGLAVAEITLFLYLKLFVGFTQNLLAPEALVGAWMGAMLRRSIWTTIFTLVPGLGWIRPYDVPAYVLTFFWFFYLLLGNLFARPGLSEAPMPYFVPFISLIMGFLLESVLLAIGRLRHRDAI